MRLEVARMDRRTFLQYTLGITAGTLLAACNRGSTSSTATPGATSTIAPTSTLVPNATTALPTATSRPAPTSTATSTATATSSPTVVAAVPECVVRPQQTEGPYFVDEKLNRSDIRSDPSDGSVKDGAPLALTFLVSSLTGSACSALAGAMVDVWQCDAAGAYSDVNDPFANTRGKKFLRGYQITDVNGMAKFSTIYPGWYPGRAVHIHFKIRTTASAGPAQEFTSQLYFDDALSDTVFASPPYSAITGNRVRNSGDGAYRQGGNQLTLQTNRSGSGYAATFNIGLQIT